MTLEFSAEDKRLIRELCRELPLVADPYEEIGRRVGLSGREVLARVRGWLESGVIRRVAAVVNHLQVGYKANAMVVWDVPPEEVERVGGIFARRDEVSHCYERANAPGWPYRLYTMVHGRDRHQMKRVIAEMAESSGVERYKVLFTLSEYKKEPPLFFAEPEVNADAGE